MADRHDIELMEHADGERELDLDDNAREKVAAIHELGELVRGHLELSADDVPQARFDAIWREVDKVVVNAQPAEPVRAAPLSVWARVGRWLDHHKSHVVVGAASAAAVAALAIVIAPGGSSDGGFASTNGPIEVRPAALRSAPSVESLDTPGGTGSVLELNDEDGHATVIWVTPQDTVEGI